jgi:hypothetical protein
LDKYQPPAAGLLENYESDYEDTNPKVGDDVANRQEASSATKPKRRTRVAAAKQLVSTVAAKVEAVKTAKLEMEEEEEEQNEPFAGGRDASDSYTSN